PVNIDLRSDPTVDAWRTHTQTGVVSPVGTTQARVTAITTNMVDSHGAGGGGQDMYWDNFSLNQTSTPFAGEKLGDAGTRGLNIVGPPSNWTIESVGGDNVSLSGNAAFAAHTGNVGMWLRAFNGGDGKILQTLPATAGGSYAFHAFSKWEANYRGADPSSSTETFLKMEFLDSTDAVLDTKLLDMKNGLDGNIFVPDAGQQQNDGMWRDFVLNGTAPALTAKIRVSAGATGMVIETGPQLSAFFDDFQLIETLSGAAASVVPEPGTMVLLSTSLFALMGIRRRSK
ncbi:MAG: PEP-CTERM sorting domain-containing protein, partial [Pirellulales bacterium]